MTIELTEALAVKKPKKRSASTLKTIAAVALGGIIYQVGVLGYGQGKDLVTRTRLEIAKGVFEEVNTLDLAIRWDSKKNEYDVKSVSSMTNDELKQALAMVVDKLGRKEASLKEIRNFVLLETCEEGDRTCGGED